MTPQQIVAVGIRLLAIWLLITAIEYAVEVPMALHEAYLEGKTAQAYVVAGLYALAAIFLWVFPMWSAHKLLPRTKFDDTIRLQTGEAARTGCALIGLWVLVKGLLGAVWFFFRASLVAGSQSVFDGLDMSARVDMVVTIASLVIGLVLIFKARSFASLVVQGVADNAPDRQ